MNNSPLLAALNESRGADSYLDQIDREMPKALLVCEMDHGSTNWQAVALAWSPSAQSLAGPEVVAQFNSALETFAAKLDACKERQANNTKLYAALYRAQRVL